MQCTVYSAVLYSMPAGHSCITPLLSLYVTYMLSLCLSRAKDLDLEPDLDLELDGLSAAIRVLIAELEGDVICPEPGLCLLFS